jgi:ketosteroid isomerase-like protein
MYSRFTRRLGVFALLALGACAPDEQPAGDAPAATEQAPASEPAPITQQDVDAFSERVNGVIRNGDTAALGNVYTDDAVMISARGKMDGGQAIRAFWTEAIRAGAGKSLQAETLKFGTSGDLAWALSRFTGGVTAPAGHTLRVFQRQADGSLRTVVQLSIPDSPAQQ